MNKAAGTLPPRQPPRGAKASASVEAAAEARAFREKNPDLRFVDALLVDICGKLRGKRFPASELDRLFASGMQIPQTIYLLDVTGDQHDPCGHGYSDGDPDGTSMPVPGTLMRVPWAQEPQAQVLMSLFEAPGVPALVEPRTVLAHVLRRISELKLKPVVAFELEFYLIDTLRAEGGAPLPATAPLDGRRAAPREAYGILELDRFADFISACENAAEIQNIPASAASCGARAGPVRGQSSAHGRSAESRRSGRIPAPPGDERRARPRLRGDLHGEALSQFRGQRHARSSQSRP